MNATTTVPPDVQTASPAAGPRSRWQTLWTAFWPVAVAAALFLGLMAHEIIAVKAQEGGRYVYPLDDTYGHLATAKNLAKHGVWSYNAADGFESSVSSLLWPFVVAACFLVFGVHEQIPLILNIVFSVATLFYASEALRRARCGAGWRVLTLVGIVALLPLCAMVSTGMEHSLQLLLTVAFVDCAARLLSEEPAPRTGPRTPAWLCVLGVLMVMTRYEGLFVISATGLLLLFRKRWKLAILLGVAAVTPTILFGLYSLHKGWYFVPNSLIIKGNRAPLVLTVDGLIQYFNRGWKLLYSEPHMPALIMAMVAALVGTLHHRRNLWTYPALVLMISLIAAAQHLQYASLGWFYRYEAYLIMLGAFGVGAALGCDRPAVPWRSWLSPTGVAYASAFALAAVLFVAPMWPRMNNAYPWIISASYSVYGQQYQMGRFVRRFYGGKSIIANDICAISYMTEGLHLTDIAGLSDIEVLRLRLARAMTPDDMRRISQERQAHMAVLYESWAKAIFQGPLPEWVKVGTWTIPHNTVVAGDTVTFYATGPEYVPELQGALQQFARELPKDVYQEGLYRGTSSMEPTGMYVPRRGTKTAWEFWTDRSAEFSLYPTTDSADATGGNLNVTLFVVSEDETVDVFFNDELVTTRAVAPTELRRWFSFPVPVKWRPGRNVLKLVGHGTPTTTYVGGEPRPSQFAVLDPRRGWKGDGTTAAQPGIVQEED